MFSPDEVELIKKRNYRKIREHIRISLGIGVNLTSPTTFKEWLRIINIILIVSSAVSMYGHWCYITRYITNIPKIGESICTALQAIISMVKMVYYLFVQNRLAVLLNKVQRHDYIRKSEIFHKDFPISKKLKLETEKILEKSWTDIRAQLVFYICSCTAIISNYFIMALCINTYHYFKETPNYTPMLIFPSVYPMWEDKGLQFPYYPMQMFLSMAADYIAGMCAVSFDGVFIILSVHAVGLIQSLVLLIKKSTSEDVPKERRVEYLRYCIFQYQRIQEYIVEINQIFKHISISQFLLSLIVWGIVLFQMGVGLESDVMTFVRMIMYISAAGYEIVIYCYNGQRVTTESELIPIAFYDCEWYDESEEFKQLLRMMIMRTNRKFNFDISGFTTMALPTLMAMMKTSGSYFLLLRNLAE